jgi:hypothetical protein
LGHAGNKLCHAAHISDTLPFGMIITHRLCPSNPLCLSRPLA